MFATKYIEGGSTVIQNRNESSQSPLLALKDVKIHYPIRTGFMNLNKKVVKAVDGVSFDIFEGETLGLVGESGCGKSTLGRAIIGLQLLTDGEVMFEDEQMDYRKRRVSLSKQIQIVFQDPYSTLNPRITIGKLLAEPLIVHGIVPRRDVEKEVDRLLELVGLPARCKNYFPHQFSGGQRQRIGIARALSLRPKLIICDEPVSALDVSIQAQILNLFKQLKEEIGLTYLFIAHGLGAVKYLSDRIAVMCAGKIVEIGSTKDIFMSPRHEYTKKLLDACPVPDPRKRRLGYENA